MSPRGRWAILAAAALLLVAGAFVRQVRGTDFDGYYIAGEAVLRGTNPYDNDAVERYPPSFAVFCAPFALLPYPAAILVWSLMNLALLGAALEAAARLGGATNPVEPDGRRLWPLLLAMPYLVDGLLLGQSHFLVLFAIAVAFLCAEGGREMRAGVLLGAVAALKVTPGLLVLYWLLRGRWRALVGCLLGGVLAGGILPLVAYGPERSIAHYRTWAGEMRQTLLDRTGRSYGKSARYQNQAPRAALVRLCSQTYQYGARSEVRVNVAEWKIEKVARVATGLNLALAGLLVLAVLRGRWDPSPERRAGEASLVALGTALFPPVAWTSHFMVLLVPYAAVFGGRFRGWPVRAALALTVAGTLGLAWKPARAAGCLTWPSMLAYGALAVWLVLSRGRTAHARDSQARPAVPFTPK